MEEPYIIKEILSAQMQGGKYVPLPALFLSMLFYIQNWKKDLLWVCAPSILNSNFESSSPSSTMTKPLQSSFWSLGN